VLILSPRLGSVETKSGTYDVRGGETSPANGDPQCAHTPGLRLVVPQTLHLMVMLGPLDLIVL